MALIPDGTMRTRWRVCARRWTRTLAATLVVVMPACVRTPSQDTLVTLRATSTFAFEARIDSLHASTLPEVQPTSHTIAVTVRDALQCPIEVGRYAGERATIQVADARGLDVGARWWFFAGGWVISDGLAVQEIARFPATARREILRHYLGPRRPVAMLEARLRASAMVAIGTLAISDNWANFTSEFRDHPERWVAVSLSIESTFGRQNNFGNPITVAIPLKGIAEWPLLQRLRYEHPLLLLLDSTRDWPDDLVAGANKPLFMLRTESSVHSVSDSAMIAESLARESNAVGLGRWLPACGKMLP